MQDTVEQSTQERQALRWRLEKTISIGNLCTLVFIAIPVLTWALALDNGVRQNAQAIQYLNREQTHHAGSIHRLEQRMESLRLEIKSDLNQINRKLDRLMESHHDV